MLNLSVRTKILALIALFSLVIVGISVSSALSSKSVSAKLQDLSSQSLELMRNLEKSRQLLLQQSVEFERGFFQVSIAKSIGGYGTEQIAESEEKFKTYTNELLSSIENVKGILATMPVNDGLNNLLAQISALEEQQAVFLEASTETYSWWVKLNTMKAGKSRRAADDSLIAVNQQMEEIITSINEYNTLVAENQNRKLDQTIYASGVLAAVLIVAGILISIIIVNGICRPLIRAVRRAEEIASGELVEPKFTSKRTDEIGLLEIAMDKLVVQLRSILHDVAESSSMLTTAANDLNRITDESSEMVDRQQEETNFISQAVQEIQATAVHVSESTNDASQAAHTAETAANEGTVIVTKTIQSIQELAAEISTSASTINELQTNTKEISNILNVILGIAEQTNLLALNAAIEAARAGEQGRGFAVVADEVRHLAQNTQNATQEIEKMISLLQTGTASAVKAMTSSHQRSTDAVNQVKHEEESLRNINQSVSKIRDMNDRISATAEEQASVTAEVSRNVANINDIASRTTKSIHAISNSADQLATLATQLSAKISYFKV
ncbi:MULTISPECIES: methyl-accepting chemotaxis protein [Marinomonas]|uniref:Tar ligand binding domain-containing protein n=1 Tax=Marinomonas arctica TaxID=383750 RepID=A0A7H1J1D3_9GAMM|nr:MULTISPECIES: methyl-accepting chemotaxis protein [Marinomonas]MCS7488282.1 chemotaxis protein [Marinomonas sp. BSi20414]QNT04299.1 Tar ligand binding domain-containing protein [Marinomonas arctica]GGN37815.1 methyl-accepting chemotaxis protein [Marinomonas arctica]